VGETVLHYHRYGLLDVVVDVVVDVDAVVEVVVVVVVVDKRSIQHLKTHCWFVAVLACQTSHSPSLAYCHTQPHPKPGCCHRSCTDQLLVWNW
jgi:hypothetical protein